MEVQTSSALPTDTVLSPSGAPERVGRKATSLGHHAAAGFDVPDGLVVAADASDDEARGAASVICRRLGPGPLAVRSSGLQEDGAERAWAGQFLTTFGVVGEEALAEAILECRRSATSMTAQAYGGLATNTLAVLVQRQVGARCAGVAFTADPVSGERDVVLIEAITGLGERLVAGEVKPERWTVRATRSNAPPAPTGTC